MDVACCSTAPPPVGATTPTDRPSPSQALIPRLRPARALRTLAPYDWAAIRASVEKTSRVIVAHEDCLSWGYGAEIAARIADELFAWLDAPVRRVGALDTWVGYHPQLEAAILPQTERLAAEMDRILEY